MFATQCGLTLQAMMALQRVDLLAAQANAVLPFKPRTPYSIALQETGNVPGR